MAALADAERLANFFHSLAITRPDLEVINSVELDRVSDVIRKCYQTMREARIAAILLSFQCILEHLQHLDTAPQA